MRRHAMALSGGRPDKAIAHMGLAGAGSVLLTIGAFLGAGAVSGQASARS
jgi:hypothetical protein